MPTAVTNSPTWMAGTYPLRIARPLEFHPYVRDNVAIEARPASTTSCCRIVTGELLPPLPEIAAR